MNDKKLTTQYLIKFQHRQLAALRERLLADLSSEYWAVILGKTERVGELAVLKAYEILYPLPQDYISQGMAFLRLKKEFIYRALGILRGRGDLNTMIDVHTHPFCPTSVAFSGVDDGDEKQFFEFLTDRFENLTYGSIVLSQTQYSSRVWERRNSRTAFSRAQIRSQCISENIISSDDNRLNSEQETTGGKKAVLSADGMFSRTVQALGLETMRRITRDQTIAVVGIGGLGSIIAEHLIHMGFHNIILIDPDTVEHSNLSRIVGAYWNDAEQNIAKVQAVARHLRNINPNAKVVPLQMNILSPYAEVFVAAADWLMVATDNHSSRDRAQQLSLKYFVPLITAGVNITVEGESTTDVSGEVITARIGDGLCLNCLGRIDFVKMASELHPEEYVRKELVQRGYVKGLDITEPAVKTLNAMVATLAVDTLVNQYSETQKHVPILVYESNQSKTIYEDTLSLTRRNMDCFTCGQVRAADTDFA